MNMAEHLSRDVGPSARVDTFIGLDQLVGKLPICDVSSGDVQTGDVQTGDVQTGDVATGDVAIGDALTEKETLFVTHSNDLLSNTFNGLISSDGVSPSRSFKAKHRMFFAAAVATAFYGSFPAWAGSHDLTDVDGNNVSSMGALNATVSAAMTSHHSPSFEVFSPDGFSSDAFLNIDSSDVDDETRLLMAELSRLAMSQAASGRVAGAGLMWADVAFADASSSNAALREVGFSPLTNNAVAQNASAQTAQNPRFVLAQHEYSKSLHAAQAQKYPRISRATLQFVAQETVVSSATDMSALASESVTSSTRSSVQATAKNIASKPALAKKLLAKAAPTAAKKNANVLPPAMPVVTTSASKSPTSIATATTIAPTILRGTTSTPSRFNLKAARRLVSVSPLQSSTRLSLSKNVGVGMKKVITVSSLKQLPPATQALPMRYGGSRRASIIPIGADMPSSGVRTGNSSTTNSNMTALPMAPSLSPARPTASRMTNQLEVATGTFVVLQTSTDLDTVAIANPDIADVAVVNSRAVLVNGKTPGITSLVIVDRDKIRQYQVRVVSAPGTLPRDIVAQIGLPGVTVRQVRDALVLEGEVEDAQEAARAIDIAGIYSKKVLNNLTVRGVPTGDVAIAARLQGTIGLPNVTVILLGENVLLQGTVDNAAQRARAEQIALLSGRKVVNLIETPLMTVEEIQAALLSSTGDVGPNGTLSSDADPSAITVRRMGGQIVLDGTAIDQARIDQAVATAGRSGLQVINRLRLIPAPTADELFSRRVQTAIGVPGVRVSGNASRLVLTGTVADTNVSNYVVSIARSLGGTVDNMMQTLNPIQINIDVQIVEINSNKARDLGVTVGGGSGQGELLFGDNGLGSFKLLDTVRGRLRALYSDGSARLLSNPRSTVLSGRPVTFQVGGQVPIPVGSTTNGSGTTSTIEFKDFGILLEASPVGNNDGVVTLRIRTEVSQPDRSLGVTTPGGGFIPGFSRRQTQTEVVVNRGGTIAIGGLIQNNIIQTVSRIPVLSEIPILGSLFKSKSFQRNQTELVIFVTPRVLPNPLSGGSMAFADIPISGGSTAPTGG